MEFYLKKEIKKLMEIFEGSFINSNYELILEKRRNIYINLELINTPKELEMNLIQWKSRTCIKGDNEKIINETRKKINKFFNKNFSLQDFELIYELLGNEINPELCEEFVDNDLDIEILKRYKEVK